MHHNSFLSSFIRRGFLRTYKATARALLVHSEALIKVVKFDSQQKHEMHIWLALTLDLHHLYRFLTLGQRLLGDVSALGAGGGGGDGLLVDVVVVEAALEEHLPHAHTRAAVATTC